MLPSPSDPRWRAIVSGIEKPKVEFLAVNILLGRIGMQLAHDRSAAAVDQAVRELHGLFQKHESLATVQRDIARIFGGTR